MASVLFALSIFLGAFLLFAVQPLLGKVVLPVFGGTAGVWTVCLLFFQTGLLAGYAYAHWIGSRLRPVVGACVHLGLLAVTLLWLPIGPDFEQWTPGEGDSPEAFILLLLLVQVGGPFVALSATAPLLQRWYAGVFPGRRTYRFYALSNAGSLLALISYPFVVETRFPLGDQAALWSWGYAAFAACCGACASWVAARPSSGDEAAPVAEAASRPKTGDLLLWLCLAACGSTMLLATTNHLCQEVAAAPLLWVAPLAVYLLTFVMCFDSPRWYRRKWFVILLAVMMLPACAMLYAGARAPLVPQIAVFSLTLLACCMCCHGELAAGKPAPRYLTHFYLAVAAGGALGGVFVGLIAPRIFPGYWEFHVALFGTCLLTAVAAHRNGAWNFRQSVWLRRAICVGLVALAIVLAGEMHLGRFNAIKTIRNFYGVLRVVEGQDEAGRYRRLLHGRISHGVQYQGEEKRHWPTLYFGPGSAVDFALRLHPRRFHPDPGQQQLRVGVIGLGTGTIAAHGRAGDYFRYYEINPAVDKLCEEYFTFREDSPARVETVMGDARRSLVQELVAENPQNFDVLVVDAFSGDAIPVHLLTRQCAAAYFAHLRHGGLLLLHISNRFVDLSPVARGLAARFDCSAARIQSDSDPSRGVKAGDWIVITRNQQFLHTEGLRVVPWTETDPPPVSWTDQSAAIWRVVK